MEVLSTDWGKWFFPPALVKPHLKYCVLSMNEHIGVDPLWTSMEYKECLRDLGIFILKEFRGILWMSMNTYREGVNEAKLFSLVPVLVKLLMGTNWNTSGFLWTSLSTSLLCRLLTTGTCCPERLWNLHAWRYSKTIQKDRVLNSWIYMVLFKQEQVSSISPFQLQYYVMFF